MDLFDYQQALTSKQQGPLAARMRPRNFYEFVGQAQIVGEGRLLRRAIEADQLSSIILHGPPGTGKTTIAKIIAESTQAHFEQLNAVTAGVNDLRQVVRSAKERLGMYGTRTILFVDEIHRFNRSQQDALLPDVEEGTLILVGATTENPSFQVNAALLSRSLIFQLELLNEEELSQIIHQALQDKERGLGNVHVQIDADACSHLVRMADGDSRRVLNALEMAVMTTTPNEDGIRHVTLEIAEESIQRKHVRYDQSGDQHYDTISAWIKSMRGSDPDASLYYLAKMILGGEDPRFIARRIMIHAAEDVGMADPRALLIASAAAHAVELVGLPEAQIPLAEAVIYLATAPKSNSAYTGIKQALEAVKKEIRAEVPHHLRDSHFPGAKSQNRGTGYQYPHDFPRGYTPQQYLPNEHLGKSFYQPSNHGYEQKLVEFMRWMKQSSDS
ncbi:putative ATPase [Thermoactinomyces sp. DSM 45891]|uniref:replication-associated recombination protein A n=1 Tax=Thermoactinomyces sp. DSM 45891 TaxID=1761907 RepID=UPI00091E3AB7|nr:replication-associated recombination protein A [Thermoactinomyces sp. DSM 45891]SFX46205.1 putative ATPase [Thermoactinomyces sp. DSM 45891]